MMVYHSHAQQPLPSAQPKSVSQTDVAGGLLVGFLVIICPSVIALGVIWCRKYRATVKRQQVEALEKLWQVRCKKENYERN